MSRHEKQPRPGNSGELPANVRCVAAQALAALHYENDATTLAGGFAGGRVDAQTPAVIVGPRGDPTVARMKDWAAEHRGQDWRSKTMNDLRFFRCDLCLGATAVGKQGVLATDCAPGMGCEMQWVEDHPDLYDPKRQDPADPQKPTPRFAPCVDGGCGAIVRALNSSGNVLAQPQTVHSRCKVREAGKGWRDRGVRAYGSEKLEGPERIAQYDGETVTPRDIQTIEAALSIPEERQTLPLPGPIAGPTESA